MRSFTFIRPPSPVLARVTAGAVLGIDAYLVTVEADAASGLSPSTGSASRRAR